MCISMYCVAMPQCYSALPDLLVNPPDSVRNAKSIPLNHLGTRLKEWELI
ncbi:hypothetical protein PS704_00922 [Pseudomonas fluorescens]|uniref:Uncharacterized protein n=1 Tax=Pseudomonas fluorescens TaxID=294 RepID=A0A5E7APR6_PSEFL|nr:hypothetical protein PS704_00922 [Pseudomonas fluorescens]